MGDIHWRKVGEALKDGRGAVRTDGLIKHGERMPSELVDMLFDGTGQGSKKFNKSLSSLGLASDSVRAAFNADPLATMEIIFLAFQGLDLVYNRDGWGT